ncbi:hypothetical protein [Lihuaxuella thermophila]|uniref:Uncharacterized protein n=1 Tax=Lihuaxuella thermophila TaxID=1173111 RepID=A0A1H8DW97_9BACL|nr:hypothetical protein [Lihuaxuella thermophila]SEN11589.1 hypothetical protein SAMN05444955_10612 [Lihuaxuella thermophila]
MGCKRRRKKHCRRVKDWCDWKKRRHHKECDDNHHKDCDDKQKHHKSCDEDCCVSAFVVQTGAEICGSVAGTANTFVTTNTNLGDPTAFGCDADNNAVQNTG